MKSCMKKKKGKMDERKFADEGSFDRTGVCTIVPDPFGKIRGTEDDRAGMEIF